MSKLSKGVSMFLLSALIMALLVMTVLGFMLGFTHPLPWIMIAVVAVIPFIHDKIIGKQFVEWSDSLSVGIESIDNDHKRLLGMINQLQTAAHYHTDDAMIEKTLNELVDYTKYHFAREEEMMQKNGYPHLEEHKKGHEAMVQQVVRFIDEYRIDQTRTIENIIQFLKVWLINHIYGSDQEYVPYIKDKNID